MEKASEKVGKKVVLWCPLIGFDREQADKGVEEFLARTGFVPDGISLFVYNADFFNLHKGMDEEWTFPRDFCNYFGNPRNDIRAVQPWTNYDLRDLVKNLKAKGVETYACVMGNHLPPDEEGLQLGLFGYPCRQEFVQEHTELNFVSINEGAYLHPLKRFKDGSYYEDFFAERAAQVLADYGIDGVHLADAFCPPCVQLIEGDYSDDMLEQFLCACPTKLPASIVLPLTDKNSAGIKARAEYIWNRHRAKWIRFVTDRWERFFKKLCDRLHKDNRIVTVCNAWTSEPFEAIYRYGIDYKKLERAGVDRIYLEDQATAIYSYDPEHTRFRIYEYMHMPMTCKAYAPNIEYLCINYAKDSSEEGAVVNHAPCADEREIYTIAAKQYIDEKGCAPVADGYFVCLSDSVTKEEWAWIYKRYCVAFRERIGAPISATAVWSDAYGLDFLDEYIQTRKPTCHRQVSLLAKRGAVFGGSVRVENLDKASGSLFVANVDSLPQAEREKVFAYQKGALVCTLFATNKHLLPKEPDIWFEDMNEPRKELRMAVAGYTEGLIPYYAIAESLQDMQGERLTEQPQYAKEPIYWYYDLIFQKPSNGFLQATADLVRLTTGCPLWTDKPLPVSYYRLADGRIRIYAENDNPMCYQDALVRTDKKIKKIDNTTGFPVLSPKLLMPNGRIMGNMTGDSEMLERAKGFVLKTPPAGISLADITLEEEV